MQMQAPPATNQGPPTQNSGWMTLQNNLVVAKAQCGISVMKQYYYASCMAASASYASNNSQVSGSSTTPVVKLNPSSCSGYSTKCVNYYTYSTQAETVRANCQNSQSLFAAQVYAVVTNQTSMTSINTELNTLVVQVLPILNSAATGTNQAAKPWVGINCNSTNTTASDCNYLCTNVLTATGFDENSYNLVSATSTTSSRMLQSTSGSISIDSTGGNPDALISNSDTNVVVPTTAIPDTSSGKALITSIAVVLSFILALII